MNNKSIIKNVTNIQLKKSDKMKNNDYTDDFFKLLQEENRDLFIKFIEKKVEAAIPDILESLKKLEEQTIKINAFEYIFNSEKNKKTAFFEINNIKHTINVEDGMYTFLFKISNILSLKISINTLNFKPKVCSKLIHVNSKNDKNVTGVEDSIIQFIEKTIRTNNKLKTKLTMLISLVTKILELCIIINNANFDLFYFLNKDLFTIDSEFLDKFYLLSDINITELLLQIKNDIKLINNLEVLSNEKK